MGNPPFVGSKYSDKEQKLDMDYVLKIILKLNIEH